MGRYKIVLGGVITNIIEAKADYAASIGATPAEGLSIGMIWDGAQWLPPTPEPPPAAFTYKIEIWRRVDDDEAETLDQLLHTVSAKLRRSFEAAQRIEHDAPEFPELQAGVTAALGADRAAAILAPSEG